ncbi:hypothetical protein [Candidatus Formimonas warabiya]|uniref:Uncharacterized protein n=1 Tax=Formimonas warabiya TaxID=1761012 RepID=A0A3G1KSK5_FORW1|nr:hypothetical protein [Candidatus Formimonas warabiya]ATW25145.1 hypothetical protein DCMF_10525 [Candidatus Formimonas warabiya]
MGDRIKINLEAVEAMLYYWHALKDREKVAEKFIYDIAEMPGLTDAYDDEFNGESVRRALSAIKNREVFSAQSKKEARFWNNNLWMMEDLSYTDAMVQPLKKLNLDALENKIREKLNQAQCEEIQVVFAPLHFDDYAVKGNKLIINFFRVKPENDTAFIGEKELELFIEEKLTELINR